MSYLSWNVNGGRKPLDAIIIKKNYQRRKPFSNVFHWLHCLSLFHSKLQIVTRQPPLPLFIGFKKCTYIFVTELFKCFTEKKEQPLYFGQVKKTVPFISMNVHGLCIFKQKLYVFCLPIRNTYTQEFVCMQIALIQLLSIKIMACPRTGGKPIKALTNCGLFRWHIHTMPGVREFKCRYNKEMKERKLV